MDDPVSVACFTCICRAASGCNLNKVCKNGMCGPFRYDMNYWIEAGRPTLYRMAEDHPQSFETCANDLYCSFFALQRYMKKHRRDCNGDGIIDCKDFMALHKLGPDNCTAPVPDSYLGRYEFCLPIVAD